MGFHSVNPKIRIEITGDDYNRLLNKIKYAGIYVEEVQIKDEKLTVSINNKDYEIIEKIVNSEGFKCDIIKEIGLYFKLKKISNLKSFIVGIAICGIILKVVSLFLWNIEFEGNHTITDEQLNFYLKTNNIKTGMFVSEIDCNALEAGLRNEYFDVTWVCAEIKGTNLIIHIKENYNKEISMTETEPYDLVAKHNSVIESVITRSGVPLVSKGDVVKEGDVLISGAVEVFNEYEEKLFTDFVNADGDVYGRTTFSYEDSFALDHTEKIVEGKAKNNLYIDIFGMTFEEEVKGEKPYYVVDEYKNMKLLGNFYIPVRLGIKKQIFYRNVTKKYTNKEAKQIAEEKLELFLKSLEEKEMQIIEKNVNIDVGNDKCISKGTVTVLEPLAKVSPIHYREEGTTDIDERN